MVVTQNIGSNVQENLPQIGGGIVGVGAPAALRETMDVQNGQPFSLVGDPGSLEAQLTRPSVVWGIGVGGLTGALWMLDVGPDSLSDFYLAHSLTAIPTGALSALLPKDATATATATTQATRTRQRPLNDAGSSPSPSHSNGEFAPSGGQSRETQPAN